MFFIKKKIKKSIALSVAISILVQSILPMHTKAMSGPTQPEFSNFAPVGSSDVVNTFTGRFSYNIPLLDIPGPNGGGYSLGLSYQSGSSPEEDASWVGYGWTLSPGSIVRNKQGFADDVDAGNISYYNQGNENWTASIGVSAQLETEIFSTDINLSVGVQDILQYNNHKGFANIAIPYVGCSVGYGLASLNYAYSDGNGSFDVGVNVANCLKENYEQNGEKVPAFVQGRGIAAVSRSASKLSNQLIGYAFGNNTMPTYIQPYSGLSFKLDVSPEAAVIPTHWGIAPVNLSGSYTIQTPSPYETKSYYGYLYSHNAAESDMMDYHIEKDAPYNKRDFNLAIPYSSADMFSVMGQGIGGSFRAFSKKAAHFYPNAQESPTYVAQLGFDIIAGADVGAGAFVGGGVHELKVSSWNDEDINKNYLFSDEGDEPYYFRFLGDKGGVSDFGNADAQAFSLSGGGSIGSKDYVAVHPDGLDSIVNQTNTGYGTERVSRSSYIAYHTNAEMELTDINLKHYKRYTNAADVNVLVDRSSANISSQIGEFSIFTEDGGNYTYGLPVYNNSYKSMSYDVTSTTDYITQKDISLSTKITGEEEASPCATSWLLTQLTNSEYIDRSLDGPTNDDFGGWTKFNYTRNYGSNDKSNTVGWYHWRLPYTGLYNNRGSLSDPNDDMGSYVSGNKEIYYMESVVTATHVAKFYISDRTDGHDAMADNIAANSTSGFGANLLSKLDSIVLYTKNADGTTGETLKRVYFTYDYSLMLGQPNSSGAVGDNGKLTLKKVWVEYGKVRNSGITPYQFDYVYPTAGSYPSKYSSLDDYGNGMDQNPDYDVLNTDRWGSYQENGALRYNEMKPWLNQVPLTSFDPAAWQLKVIKLPSGGQMHVQYEQNKYAYVQNKTAMAMLSLDHIEQNTSAETDDLLSVLPGTKNDKYYLNLNDLGITAGSAEAGTLAKMIKEQFIDGKNGNEAEKIYFKFLYSLSTTTAGINECESEYIDGYVNVTDVQSDASGLYLTLQSSSADAEAYHVPREVCVDFYNTNKVGMLNFTGAGCVLSSSLDIASDASSTIMNLLAKVGDAATTFVEANVCTDVDESHSYIRVPLPTEKKGGGVRVKRILMYDQGIESGDESLYGYEYLYQNADGSCSGVAANEPAEGKEENALITYMPKRADQEFMNKVISGRDKEQFEGPLGESILASPSIGYSRVVTKNIHDGKTNDGFNVMEYYTTKDYPLDGSFSYVNSDGVETSVYSTEYTEMKKEDDWIYLPAVVLNTLIADNWASQGYRFILNNMNGQIKSTSTYTGNYNDIDDVTKVQLFAQQQYEYYQPGEPVKVVHNWQWDTNTADADLNYEYQYPGMQSEVVMFSRQVSDISANFTIEADASAGIAPPAIIPYVSVMPYVDYSQSILSTHVTNKMIYYPAIVKSVKSYHDGAFSYSKNEYINAQNGAPIVTSGNDGYAGLKLPDESGNHNGKYVSYNFPASHYYTDLGAKSLTERAVVKSGENGITINKLVSGGSIYQLSLNGDNVCDALQYFTPGDLVSVTDASSVADIFHVGEIKGTLIELLPNGDFTSHISSRENVNVEILKSGKTNQLNAAVGNLTSYGGEPNATDHPVSSAIIAARQTVADALNAQLAIGSGMVNLNYPSLSVIGLTGSCDPLNVSAQLNLNITNYGGFTDTLIGFTLSTNCTEEFNYDPSYVFFINDENAELYYGDTLNECTVVPVSCFDFCPDEYEYITLDKVISAGAVELTDDWKLDDVHALIYGIDYTSTTDDDNNAYEFSSKGKWRPSSPYHFQTNISNVLDAGGYVYNTGIYDNFTAFNWEYSGANDAVWTKVNTDTVYSPNGNLLESKNILDIKSVSKYGYSKYVPYLAAANANYDNVLFESFENYTYGCYGAATICFEDDYYLNTASTYYGGISSSMAHAGSNSYEMDMQAVTSGFPAYMYLHSESELPLKSISIDEQLADYGMLVKCWVKVLGSSDDPSVLTLDITNTYNATYNQSVNFEKVLRVGEWTLYQAKIDNFILSQWPNSCTPTIKVQHRTNGAYIYVDDVRMQAQNSQMTSYVYDPTNLKLLTQFGDQHVGVFYQYNDEGKLIRNLIETSKGLKTVSESQYNVPAVSR